MSLLPGLAPELPPVSADGAAGDEWYTPRFILDWIGPVAMDPCWSHASLVQANAVLDLRQGQDGTRDPWEPVGDGVIYVNPPYSDTSTWLDLCRKWSMLTGRIVVALVPALPGDKPWHKYVWGHANYVGYPRGRLDFVNPEGRWAEKGRGHAIILWGPEPDVTRYMGEVFSRALRHPQAPFWTTAVHPF